MKLQSFSNQDAKDFDPKSHPKPSHDPEDDDLQCSNSDDDEEDESPPPQPLYSKNKPNNSSSGFTQSQQQQQRAPPTVKTKPPSLPKTIKEESKESETSLDPNPDPNPDPKHSLVFSDQNQKNIFGSTDTGFPGKTDFSGFKFDSATTDRTRTMAKRPSVEDNPVSLLTSDVNFSKFDVVKEMSDQGLVEYPQQSILKSEILPPKENGKLTRTEEHNGQRYVLEDGETVIQESKREMTETEKKEMDGENNEILARSGEGEVDLDMGDWLKEEDKPIGIKKSDGDRGGSAPVKKF